jgi:hypothetical protein
MLSLILAADAQTAFMAPVDLLLVEYHLFEASNTRCIFSTTSIRWVPSRVNIAIAAVCTKDATTAIITTEIVVFLGLVSSYRQVSILFNVRPDQG